MRIKKGEVNQPLHTDWLNNKLNQLEKKYGLPHIIPHGLRHTFVSELLNQGIDGLIIKSLVGHAETSNMIRNVYGHTNDQTKIDTLKLLRNTEMPNKMDNWLRGTKKSRHQTKKDTFQIMENVL